MSPASCPRLAIAIGDPAGIGTEVTLKALATASIWQRSNLTLIGSRQLIQQAYNRLQTLSQSNLPHFSLPNLHDIPILDVPLDAAIEQQIILGQGNAASGEASFRYLETAIAHTLSGTFEGIVTAPIAKSAWNAAGHSYPGQTELLAEKAQVNRFGMLFVARSPYTHWVLRTLLATTHIPLRQVPDMLTPELMTRKLELLVDCLRSDFGIASPHIAIAGLNPHSGEGGQLGREEIDWLIPWIQTMRDRLAPIQLTGPLPPDTLWVRPGQAWYGHPSPVAAHDAYLALYHDQGLIPVKLMAFDRAVNTTIGLPFVRTSPDHGTAFDIASQGIADASSMVAAVQLAGELVEQRRQILKI